MRNLCSDDFHLRALTVGDILPRQESSDEELMAATSADFGEEMRWEATETEEQARNKRKKGKALPLQTSPHSELGETLLSSRRPK